MINDKRNEHHSVINVSANKKTYSLNELENNK